MKIENVIKFITDSKTRFGILATRGFYNNVPDDIYLKKRYKAFVGNELNLDNPQTFNEKLQWLKIHDRKPIYTTMVDKYEAKKYVAKLIGEEYIIPTLGVWDNFNDICFDTLPNQFVLKCTHDSGGLVICRDKSKLDIKNIREKINKSLKRNYYYSGREWPYKNVKPRIIAEEYMEDDKTKELQDYKFFCFDGHVKCLYVSEASHTNEQKLQFFDKDFIPMDCRRKDYKQYTVLPNKPENFDSMIEIAEKLSKGIPHVRVDLYEINGNIYFGELTLFTGSGFIPFELEEWDNKFGEWINLPNFTPVE